MFHVSLPKIGSLFVLQNSCHDPVHVSEGKIESKVPIEVTIEKNNTLVIRAKKSNNVVMRGGNITISGNSVSCVGGRFSGNLSMVCVGGKTYINGVPAEQFKREQQKARQQEEENSGFDTKYNRTWTIENAVRYTNIDNLSSGDLFISTSCLHPVCEFETSSSGNLTITSPSDEIATFKTINVRCQSSGDIMLPDLFVEERAFFELNSSGDVNASQLICPVVICNVLSSGSASFDNVNINNATFQTNGSGGIQCMRGHIDNGTTSSSSSGDVQMSCSVNVASASTRGSGNVVFSHVQQKMQAISRSSGDIRVTADSACEVYESQTGSGSIHIKRRKFITPPKAMVEEMQPYVVKEVQPYVVKDAVPPPYSAPSAAEPIAPPPYSE